MPMRVAIYVRVSTQRQAQTQTIDQQLDRLRLVVAQKKWPLPDDNVFRDDGFSGATLRRPGLDRLRDATAGAKFDVILITDPDRLARNYVHQVLLLEELQRHGCRIEFTDRPLSDDPQDQLLLQIRGAVAEYERTLIAERTRRGRLHKLQSGQLLPWTRPPYGYRADPDRPRDPAGVRADPVEAVIVADMFEWYACEGRSMLGLAQRLHDLGIPSPTGKKHWGQPTLRGILTNPTFTGTLYANRTKTRPARIRRSSTHPIGKPRDSMVALPPEQWVTIATVPAIVTREQFDRVQAKIATNRSFAKRNNTTGEYLLRALVSCGACGLACLGRQIPTQHKYYTCTGKMLQVRQRTGTTCKSRFIRVDKLDDLVWTDLTDLLRHPNRVAHALQRAAGGCWLPQELQFRQANLLRGRAAVAQQIERLTEAYLSEVVSLQEYQRRRGDLERRDAVLAQQQDLLSGEASRAYDLAGLANAAESFAHRVSKGLETATFERKRQLVELLVDRVVVTGSTVEIRYAFPVGPAGESGRFCHLRLDYLRAPHLVRVRNHHVPQQIREHTMARRRLRQVPLRRHARDVHPPHQPLNPLAIHLPTLVRQHRRDAARTVTRVLQIDRVDRLHQRQVLHALRDRRVIRRAPRQVEQVALTPQADRRVIRIEQAPTHLSRGRRVFLSHSSSMSSRPIRSNSSVTNAAWPESTLAPVAKADAAPASSCFFHCVIWIGCTPWTVASCAVVWRLATAARATLALNSGLRFVRVLRAMIPSGNGRAHP
jgi:site-specific DNA recombinase